MGWGHPGIHWDSGDGHGLGSPGVLREEGMGMGRGCPVACLARQAAWSRDQTSSAGQGEGSG